MLISASKLTTFSICPRQFYYKYIQKLQPKTSNYPLILGTILHKVYEKREQYKEMNLESIIKDFTQDILQVEDPFYLTLELATTIPKILEYPISYLPRWVEKGFVLNSEFSPLLYNLSKEKIFPLMNQFPDGWVGFFDEVIWGDEVEIIDLKTGFTKKVAKYQVQQDLYILAMFEIYKRLYNYYPSQIKFTFRLLRYGDEVSVIATPEGLENIKSKLNSLKNVLESAIQTNHFPASPSHFCAYCGYIDKCISETQPRTYDEYKHLLSALKATKSKLHPAMLHREKVVFRWEKVTQFIQLLEKHPELKQFVKYKEDLYEELLEFKADIDVDGLQKYLIELGISEEFLKTIRG